MKILAVDTTGATCGVALMADGDILWSKARALHRTHSTEVMPMIDAALTCAGLTPQQIDLYACVVGPGSFTGVRIGVSTVRGLAHATGKPCLPINALEALAYGCGIQGVDVLCPLIDARSQQVYSAAFAPGQVLQRVLPDTAGAVQDYLSNIRSLGSRFGFCGDGAAQYREIIADILGEAALFPQEKGYHIDPEAVARLAMEKGMAAALPYQELLPHYVRAPQAERERLAREGKHDT